MEFSGKNLIPFIGEDGVAALKRALKKHKKNPNIQFEVYLKREARLCKKQQQIRKNRNESISAK